MTEPTDVDLNGVFQILLTKSLQDILAASRFNLSNEKETQLQISQVLAANNIDHLREYRLSPRDIADFFLPNGPEEKGARGAVLEVKMNSARPVEILRQLVRYAEHDRVESIFLITNKAMGLPTSIRGKPAYFISLGRAWL